MRRMSGLRCSLPETSQTRAQLEATLGETRCILPRELSGYARAAPHRPATQLARHLFEVTAVSSSGRREGENSVKKGTTKDATLESLPRKNHDGLCRFQALAATIQRANRRSASSFAAAQSIATLASSWLDGR